MLSVVANDADPADTAAVLRLAAPRLTNALFFRNEVPEDRKKVLAREAIELPCFDGAVQLFLHLGYLHLALPPSGVFTKLTVLVLSHGSKAPWTSAIPCRRPAALRCNYSISSTLKGCRILVSVQSFSTVCFCIT